MRELEASPFLSAVTELRHLIVLLDSAPEPNANTKAHDRMTFVRHVEKLSDAISKLQARSALASAGRLRSVLESSDVTITYQQVLVVLRDIESRFSDHLNDIRLFVLSPGESALFEPADALLSTDDRSVEGFSRAFPNAAFEIEESAKCIALSRHTASVFHNMRAIEQGLKGLSAFLEIPNPTKASERNWGIMLKAISEALDKKWPRSMRLPGFKGGAA